MSAVVDVAPLLRLYRDSSQGIVPSNGAGAPIPNQRIASLDVFRGLTVAVRQTRMPVWLILFFFHMWFMYSDSIEFEFPWFNLISWALPCTWLQLTVDDFGWRCWRCFPIHKSLSLVRCYTCRFCNAIFPFSCWCLCWSCIQGMYEDRYCPASCFHSVLILSQMTWIKHLICCNALQLQNATINSLHSCCLLPCRTYRTRQLPQRKSCLEQ